MKIVIYDPLFSEVGHFMRYNVFMSQIIAYSGNVSEVVVIGPTGLKNHLDDKSEKIHFVELTEDVKNFQTKTIELGFVKKILVYARAISSYKTIIDGIIKIEPSIVFFSSQGNLPFWIALLFSRSFRFIISAISIRWLHKEKLTDNINWYLYKKVLNKAFKISVTEEIYKKYLATKDIHNTFVFPDRVLGESSFQIPRNEGQSISLVTLGTISRIKSPLNFIKSFMEFSRINSFKYTVIGKVMDDSSSELSLITKNSENIAFEDRYVRNDEFELLMTEANFVVIPYGEEYTKYATSGVMWDCFERRIPIICPDHSIFRFYLSRFRVGYLYNSNNLHEILNGILDNDSSFYLNLENEFESLHQAFSRDSLVNMFHNQLNINA